MSRHAEPRSDAPSFTPLFQRDLEPSWYEVLQLESAIEAAELTEQRTRDEETMARIGRIVNREKVAPGFSQIIQRERDPYAGSVQLEIEFGAVAVSQALAES